MESEGNKGTVCFWFNSNHKEELAGDGGAVEVLGIWRILPVVLEIVWLRDPGYICLDIW